MRLLRVAVNAEQLLYRSPGGIGRYTAQLLTVLPASFTECEMVPFTAGHRAQVVAAALAGAGADPAVSRRAARQLLPRPLLYEAWLRVGRPALHGVGRQHVVHAPSVAVPPPGPAALVVTVHDAAPELYPEAFPARGLRFHRLGLAAAARADAVITVSQAAAAEIADLTPIPADRITVVPNGVEPRPGTPAADARALADLGLAGRRFVLWVGSLEPRKGVSTLVAAMAELRRRGGHDDVLTVLAGFTGWMRDDALPAADRATLGDSLRQVGRVSEDQLWALYRHAEVLACPSRHEGFGLPVVEAMSQGTPVVASDIPALREVAGGAAMLVPPAAVAAWADALGAVIDDSGLRARLAADGRARSRGFSTAAMAGGTWAVYQRIAS